MTGVKSLLTTMNGASSALNQASTTPLGGTQAWCVWLLAVAFVVYKFSVLTGYSIVNPSIQKDVGLSVRDVANLAATFTWVFAVCQLLSGALLDRLGARKVLLPAIALETLGVVVFGLGTSYPALLAAQFIMAVGSCAAFVGAGYVGGQWFGIAKFSFMFGLVQFVSSIFSAFNENLFSLALQHMEWRELFHWIAGAGVLLFVLATLYIRNPAPIEGPGLSEGVGPFLKDVWSNIVRTAKIPHVWIAAVWGALVFGSLLAMGVVWAPKLLVLRGMPLGTANIAASLPWVGLAVGCVVVPKWSDVIRHRKLPTLAGIVVQLASLIALLYLGPAGTTTTMALCFLYGFGAAAHMLAFSTAADVVPPSLIGTSAAIVNGAMFAAGGILIATPGHIAASETAAGMPPSMQLAHHAAGPLLIGLAASLLLAFLMRETFPTKETPA